MAGQGAPNVSLTPIVADRAPDWPRSVSNAPAEPPPVWTPASGTNDAPKPQTPQDTFVTGVNLGGDAVTINGQHWLDMIEAQAQGMRLTGGVADRKSISPQPATDGDTRAMLNTLLYAPQGDLGVSLPLPNGTYSVYVWALENYASNVRSWNLQLEGQTAARDLGFLPLNTWTNYGPYAVTVQDGVLNLDLVRARGTPMLSGFAVYQADGATPPSNTSVPTTAPTVVPTHAPPLRHRLRPRTCCGTATSRRAH